MSPLRHIARHRFLILGVLVWVAAMLVAGRVVVGRGSSPPDPGLATLLLFAAPFALVGLVCDLLHRRESRRWPGAFVFVAASLPPFVLTVETWVGVAVSLEEKAWTGAALANGLGWMLVAASAVVGVVFWVAVVRWRRAGSAPSARSGDSGA